MAYPRSTKERFAIRDRRRGELIRHAEEQARMSGLSMNCQSALKREAHFGTKEATPHCKNDGSNCLCFCHDPIDDKESGDG